MSKYETSATEAERSLRQKAAAHRSWANTVDRTARTRRARAAFEEKFLTEAGGDSKRAEHLRKAYYAELAAKSAQSRRRNKARRQVDNGQMAQTLAESTKALQLLNWAIG